MKMNIIKTVLFVAVLSLGGCETFDLDQTENPSTLPESYLDPVYTFNYAQLSLPDFVHSANQFSQRVTRQMAMTGGNTYNNAFAPVNFDQNWTQGYLILNAIKIMEPKAIENNQTFILGASKVIRCYVLMTMVDMYGDIPYSEALMGNANLTPKFDDSEAIYAGVYDELNQAITYLQDPGTDLDGLVARDLYYGNEEGAPNAAAWIKVANTLKFKMLNNSRLEPSGLLGTHNIADEMEALATTPNTLIEFEADNFAFKYGNIRVNPNSRHPLYNDHYELGGGAYIANYFMWAVSTEKATPTGAYAQISSYLDPRTKFYFFNQTSDVDGDNQTLPCNEPQRRPSHYLDFEYWSFYQPNDIEPAFCVSDFENTSSSFWGRDHGDNSGIPLDADSRTVVGLYPAGGAFGTPTPVAPNGNIAGTKGALGEGIMPIMMSSFVKFMIAEAMLDGTISGGDAGAKSAYIAGVTESIDKVIKPINGYPVLSPLQQTQLTSRRTAYINAITGYWTTFADKRLELIIKEYYIASWGNGIEPYNNYRRTGFPSNFQPTLELDSGDYFYTALYPGASVNNNPNAPSNIRTKKVFWDPGLELY